MGLGIKPVEAGTFFTDEIAASEEVSVLSPISAIFD
jgi:hypothetical protein